MRYNTYLNWAGGQVTGPGAVQQYVWQTSQRIIWEIKSGAQSTDIVNDDEGIPVIIGGETTFQNAWNVMDGSSANNTPIIIWPLSSTFENSVFLAELTTSNTAASEFLNPTSATDPSSSLTPTNFRSSITTPTTIDTTNLLPSPTSPTTTIRSINTGQSSSTSTPSTASTASSSSHGLPLDDRISLALGISFGIPTLILGIWGIWITIRVAKGHYQRRKFKRLPTTDSASGRQSATRIRKQRDRRYFEMQRK
ncbi:hypothetical protein BDN70DRAFT_875223 [Pholiota conissans]|uniref:Uncharacterized protein n=1 Tax=Pholiota conissans TaxID=109636 RepID=A0A9P5Z7K9_9AGAR|nr:hypothetical protein BDN70DRAFT_875223 [Pholiota conissans]